MKPMQKKLAGRGSRLLNLALAPAFAASLTACSYFDSNQAPASAVRTSAVSSTSADSGAATTTATSTPTAPTCSATGMVPGLDLLLVNAGGANSAGLQNSILGNLGQLLGQLPSNTNFNIGVLNPNGTLASGSSELTQWVGDLSLFTSRFQAWGYAANVSIDPTVISQMKGVQDPSDIKNFAPYVQSFPLPTDLAMLYGSIAGRADALPNIAGVPSVVSGTTGVTNVADLQGVLAGLLGSSTAPVPGAASGNGLQAILNLFGGNGNLGTAMGAGMFQPGSALGLLFAGDPSNSVGICLEGAGGACNGGGASDILGMLQGFMGGGQVGIGSFFPGMPGMTGTGATGGMPNLMNLFGGMFGGQMGQIGQGGMNSPANILALLSGGLAIPATGDAQVGDGMGQMGQLLAGLLGGGVSGGATGCSPFGGFDFGSILGGLGNFGGLGGMNGGLGNIFGGLLGGGNTGLGGLAGLFPSLNGATTGGQFGGLSQILSLFGGFGGSTTGVGGLTGFPGLNGLIPGLAMPGGFGGIPGMPSLGVTDSPLSMITNLFGGLGGSANGGLGGIFGGLLGGTGTATNPLAGAGGLGSIFGGLFGGMPGVGTTPTTTDPMAGLGGLFGGLTGSASNPLGGLLGGGTNPLGGLFGASNPSNPMMGGLSMLPMLGQLPSLVGNLFGGIMPPVATAPTTPSAPAAPTTPVTPAPAAPAAGLGGIFGNLFGGLFGGGLFGGGTTPGLLPDPVAGS